MVFPDHTHLPFNVQRAACILPPLVQKTESVFLPIYSDWLFRRIAHVLKSGIYSTFTVAIVTKIGSLNRFKIEKLSLWTKSKAFGELHFKN